MTTTTSTSPNLRANGETREHLAPRVLAREAMKVCADLGLNMRGARVRRLIDLYLREGRTDLDFRTWFLGYADPTGEAAVHNVLRDRS